MLGALIRKEVDLVIDGYTGLKGAIDGGQALPIAVTGETRNPALPDVPTVVEAGVADCVVTGWNAIYLTAALGRCCRRAQQGHSQKSPNYRR